VNDSLSKAADAQGTLFVVATPIGNLADLSKRALEVLSSVCLVLAEDTRHSKRLFNHYGISTKLRACHEHNEAQLVEFVYQQLEAGNDLALISDAGTPLISDPGFVLVRTLRERGCNICAVPGPSSLIAALSIAGLPTDAFVFDGFLSAKGPARRVQLERYLAQTRTTVLFESSHRILACLMDIQKVLGNERRVVVARELTKKFETVLDGSAEELIEIIQGDEDQRRGEFVVMIAGAPKTTVGEPELEHMLTILLEELPLKQASNLAARLTASRKNDVYQLALKIKQQNQV